MAAETVTAPRAIAAIDPEAAASALEHVLATGDLAELSPKQRVGYYLYLCKKLGVDSEARPFDWLVLDGRLVFYPNKSCAEQLRRQHQISVELTRKEVTGDLFAVEVKGTRPNGQVDFASKYVPLIGRQGRLTGQLYANALMKAETGAKRRLTFSMVGLGAVPEPEDIQHARLVTVDAHGNVLDAPTQQQRYLAEHPNAARIIGEPTFETTATPEDSPVQGGPSQGATPEELQPPTRSGPRPSLRPSKEQIEQWQRTWFATVKGTSLDDDDERHRFVEQWTCSMPGWPVAKQTESLPVFLARCTEREAEDFLGHVRALVDDERAAAEEALAAHRAESGHEHPEADEGAI